MKGIKEKLQYIRKNPIKSKHLYGILTIVCFSGIVSTLSTNPIAGKASQVAGFFVVPFEKGIDNVGRFLSSLGNQLKDKQDMANEIKGLKDQVANLSRQNNTLSQDKGELARLNKLYKLDKEYGDFPKVAARVIGKNPGSWYDVFMINKGSKDGIRVNNNVIADQGLVGIVTKVGPNWATIRSIIDDGSNVSAMTLNTRDTCIVSGDLSLVDEGKLRFKQLNDKDNKIKVGDRMVTSNISEKYLEGIFIGYISEISLESNNLTKTGTITSPVDFRHLTNVLVITKNKDTIKEPLNKDSGGGSPEK